MQLQYWQHLIDKSDVIGPVILLLFITLSNWIEGRHHPAKREYDEQDRDLIKFLGSK